MLVSLAACRADDNLLDDGSAPVRAVQESDEGYRVIFRGLVVDTLSGRSQFGHIIDPRTRERNWIVELVMADDFAGGMVIALPSDQPPSESRYDVSIDALEERPEGGAVLAYRHGLYRVFRGRAGSVTFTHVSDTLVSGNFDVTLVGEVAERGREAIRGESEISGSFAARPGQPGYVLGL